MNLTDDQILAVLDTARSGDRIAIVRSNGGTPDRDRHRARADGTRCF